MTTGMLHVAVKVTFHSVRQLPAATPIMAAFMRKPGTALDERNDIQAKEILRRKNVFLRVLGCDILIVQSLVPPLRQQTPFVRSLAKGTTKILRTVTSSRNRGVQCLTWRRQQIDFLMTWPLVSGCANTSRGLLATKRRWRTQRTGRDSLPERRTTPRPVQMKLPTDNHHRPTMLGIMDMSDTLLVAIDQQPNPSLALVIRMVQDTPGTRTTDR